MRKILFAVTSLMFLAFVIFQNISSQSAIVLSNSKTDDESNHFSLKILSNDLRTSDVVAYVNVKEVKYAGRSDYETDCENNTQGGYCAYLLIAEVKEVFKGKIETKPFEFYESADATYPKRFFLGEKVVFLTLGEENKNKKRNLSTIENSTRPIENNVLEKMRNIVNPQTVIDENDEREPYSFISVKKEFEEADAVIFADVKSFRSDKDAESGSYPFILEAEIKEIFKGNLKTGQKFEYKEDLSYRPIRNEDLGEQVIFLERVETEGKVFYERINYPISDIRHNIVEKLQKISKEH